MRHAVGWIFTVIGVLMMISLVINLLVGNWFALFGKISYPLFATLAAAASFTVGAWLKDEI